MKRLIGIHDPLGAVLAHEAGFDGVWVSGLEVSASLARPDRDLNSPDRLAQVVADIRQVYSGPVYVDADSGFGGPLQAAEAARRLVHAGATGLCMEDKVFPKTNSFSESEQILESIAEFSRKLRAVQRTVNPEFEVIARTEAYIAGFGTDEVLKRIRAYEDQGVDAVLIHSKSTSDEEIREFQERYDGSCPLWCVPTTYSQVTGLQLAELGYSVAVYANHGMRARLSATRDIFESIRRDDGTAGVDTRIASVRDVFAIQGHFASLEFERNL